jgi:hypothetical protein
VERWPQSDDTRSHFLKTDNTGGRNRQVTGCRGTRGDKVQDTVRASWPDRQSEITGETIGARDSAPDGLLPPDSLALN